MSKLSNRDLYELLSVIKTNGNIRRLTRFGFSLVDITKSVKLLLEDGMLEYVDGAIKLSDSGSDFLEKTRKSYTNKEKDNWIDLEKSSKIEKLDINFIYLPDQSKIDLLLK